MSEGSPSPPSVEDEGAKPESVEAEGEATEVAPEPPAKRKKRKPREDEATASPAPAVEEAVEVDEGVPAFARAWPRDAALTALVVAFEAGNYARVRREAPALAKRTDDDAVRRAARELRRRLDPDPIAVYMLMAAAGLLVFLAGWYWMHPHEGADPHTPIPAGPLK